MSNSDFDKLFKEYQICNEKASKLESNIWQTAALFGIGSGVGLISMVWKNNIDAFYTIIAAIFAINISFVWWRFAKRWWSIEHLMLERMRQIENQPEFAGFNINKLISQRDEEARCLIKYLGDNGCDLQNNWYRSAHIIKEIKICDEIKERIIKHIKYLQVNAGYFKRKWFSGYKISESVEPHEYEGFRNYEYRGIQPVCKLLLLTNISLWSLYALLKSPFTFLFCIAILVSIDIWFWRKP